MRVGGPECVEQKLTRVDRHKSGIQVGSSTLLAAHERRTRIKESPAGYIYIYYNGRVRDTRTGKIRKEKMLKKKGRNEI